MSTAVGSLGEVYVYRCYQQSIQQMPSFFSSSLTPNEEQKEQQEGHEKEKKQLYVLNNRSCYIFYVSSIQQIFVWIGPRSAIEDSQYLDRILLDLVNDFQCMQPAVVWRRLDDTTSSVEFQHLLASVTVEKKEPKKNDPIRVFQYETSNPSSPSLQLLATFHPDSASYSTKLPMSILDDQLTIVIECGVNVYLWLGQHCHLPPNLVMIHSQFPDKRVQTILQHKEPALFRVLFHDWDSKKIISSYSSAIGQSEGVPTSSPIGTPRRKSLVEERRKSFSKNNSVPNISSILPQRQGSFYTKVQDQDKGPHAKWSLVPRSPSAEEHSPPPKATAKVSEGKGQCENRDSDDRKESSLEEHVNSKETSREEHNKEALPISIAAPAEDSILVSTEVRTENPEITAVNASTPVPMTETLVLDDSQPSVLPTEDPLVERAKEEEDELRKVPDISESHDSKLGMPSPVLSVSDAMPETISAKNPEIAPLHESHSASLPETTEDKDDTFLEQKELAVVKESHHDPQSKVDMTSPPPAHLSVSDVLPHDSKSPNTEQDEKVATTSAAPAKRTKRTDERNQPSSTIPTHQKDQCFCM